MKKNLKLTILDIISKEKDLNKFESLNNEEHIYEICKEYGYEETYEVFIKELNNMLKELAEEMEEDESKLSKVSGGSFKSSRKIASGILSLLTLTNSGFPGAKAIDSSVITKKLSNVSEKCKSWWKNASGKEKSNVVGLGGSAVIALGTALVISANKLSVLNPKGYFLNELKNIRQCLNRCDVNLRDIDYILTIFKNAKGRLDNIFSTLGEKPDPVILDVHNIDDISTFLGSVKYYLSLLANSISRNDTNFIGELSNEISEWNTLKEKFEKIVQRCSTSICNIQSILTTINNILDHEAFSEQSSIQSTTLTSSTSVTIKDDQQVNGEYIKKILNLISVKFDTLIERVTNRYERIEQLNSIPKGISVWYFNKSNKLKSLKSGAKKWKLNIEEEKRNFESLLKDINNNCLDINEIQEKTQKISDSLEHMFKTLNRKDHIVMWQVGKPETN